MLIANMLSALLAVTPIETDCLFVLAHTGETNEMLPIMEEMQKQEKEFKVLALGVAQDLIKNRVDPSKQLQAAHWGVAIEKNWPIDRELPKNAVEAVAKEIHARIVVTGVAMLPQKQFLEAYASTAKTFAFWDNPEPRGAVPYFSTALNVQAAASKVLFPSGFVASAKEFAERPEEQKLVIGKPTLLYSLEDLQRIDKKAVLETLHFTSEQPVIAFIGTYGDRYEKAFQMFIEALNTTIEPKSQVIVQIHPMANGDFEQHACTTFLNKKQQYIVSPKNGVSMLEALAVADIVVTYNSSAGFQALLGGKRVIYVVPEGDAYSNSLIEQGLVYKVSSPQAFSTEVTRKFSSDSPGSLIDLMHIPLDPKERFLHLLYGE
ncbi:MAG: CDP-glycerol glycerophosphotransferase family protein [Simkania sp.]|nr:CDP-glycerol glycerophosphotransferase family protein [Simkania sp.]